MDALPDDVLITMFEYCDIRSLGRLSRTCKKFKELIATQDIVWRSSSLNVVGSNMSSLAMRMRCKLFMPYKERCRVSKYWQTNLGNLAEVDTYKKCMPWISLEREYLFLSKRRELVQFKRYYNGSVYYSSILHIPYEADICKFAVNKNEVVCGGSDGRLTRIEKHSLKQISSIKPHAAGILAVDAKKDIIISGSTDSYIKIWKARWRETELRKEIKLKNRVLSTAIMPSNTSFLVGSPGTKSVHPLQLYDLASGKHIVNLGQAFRNGAGILDLYPDSCNMIYSCGYDTTLQLWDIRCPNYCVATWTEPFDNALYCVRSDHNVSIMTATAGHGSFLLWDKRAKFPLRNYFVPIVSHTTGNLERNGPVYCLNFDALHIYVAFERALHQYSYTASQPGLSEGPGAVFSYSIRRHFHETPYS